MPPKSNQVKKAKKLAADKALGIKSMTVPMGPATQKKLAALQLRYQFEDWRELLCCMIEAVHDGSFPEVLPVPRHEYKPSPKVLRKLYDLGMREVDPDADDNRG